MKIFKTLFMSTVFLVSFNVYADISATCTCPANWEMTPAKTCVQKDDGPKGGTISCVKDTNCPAGFYCGRGGLCQMGGQR